jgi:hypothetical protein
MIQERNLMQAHPEQDARSILEEVQALIADPETVGAIATIYAGAECHGPSGQFQTEIWSAKDGFVRFEQRSSRGTTIAGVSDSRSWALDDGELAEIDLATELFLHGHELHMLALYPLSRFKNPVYSGQSTFGGQQAIEIQFQDKLDNPASIYYDLSDYHPRGMRTVNPFNGEAGEIRIEFQDWKQLDNGLFFFTKASFHQGGEVWTYEYTTIEIKSFELDVFDPSMAMNGQLPSGEAWPPATSRKGLPYHRPESVATPLSLLSSNRVSQGTISSRPFFPMRRFLRSFHAAYKNTLSWCNDYPLSNIHDKATRRVEAVEGRRYAYPVHESRHSVH